MARKRPDDEPETPTGYVPARDESGRVDRNLHRDHMADLKALTERLARIPQKLRRNLPMDEELQDHLQQLADADPRADRRRLVLRTRTLLADVDLPALLAALDGQDPVTLRDQALVHWRTRIVTEGDAALQAFVADRPSADRQAIRASAREARGTGPAAARAQARLMELLREAGEPEGLEG